MSTLSSGMGCEVTYVETELVYGFWSLDINDVLSPGASIAVSTVQIGDVLVEIQWKMTRFMWVTCWVITKERHGNITNATGVLSATVFSAYFRNIFESPPIEFSRLAPFVRVV